MAKAAAKSKSKTASRSTARAKAPAKRRAAPAPKPRAAARKKPQHFTVAHARNGEFKTDGLRPYARYRDLGIAAASGGLCQAHVIRLQGPKISRNLTTDWYAHRVDERFARCLR